VRVVPACDRCGADIVNVEIRADNLQGLLPAPGAHGRAYRLNPKDEKLET
jgi:hypothetical protein